MSGILLKDEHCWYFFRSGDSIWARLADDNDPFTLFETDRSEDPLYCKGPDVGA